MAVAYVNFFVEVDYGLLFLTLNCRFEIFNETSFDTWVNSAAAPALPANLILYNELKELGFRIFLLTGRSEYQRNATEANLMLSGYKNWERLILRYVDYWFLEIYCLVLLNKFQLKFFVNETEGLLIKANLPLVTSPRREKSWRTKVTGFMGALVISGVICGVMQWLHGLSNSQTQCIIFHRIVFSEICIIFYDCQL